MMKDKKNKQNLKIQKALKLIYKRLPSTYPRVGVKTYNTTYSMIKSQARKYNMGYKDMYTWYRIYLENREKGENNYINTKYYRKREKFKNFSNKKLEIAAFACNPIKISLENTCDFTIKNYVYLLLHEIAHLYYRTKNIDYNEKLADLFAIRWIKKI